MKKIDYKGDGLSFFDAVNKDARKKIDIQIAMGIASTSTFYGLYRKETFDQDEKAAAAKALNKTVKEIFAPKEGANTKKNPTEQEKKDNPQFNNNGQENVDSHSERKKRDEDDMIDKLINAQANYSAAALEQAIANKEDAIARKNNSEVQVKIIEMLTMRMGKEETGYGKTGEGKK